MYPSTEMLISVQKYKLQYGKISPILSTQITAPVQKIINIWSSSINKMTILINYSIIIRFTSNKYFLFMNKNSNFFLYVLQCSVQVNYKINNQIFFLKYLNSNKTLSIK